ncbi:MAG TPA: hypothetical protein VGE18_02245 [Candidatus Paceibacterota bacterium]
MKENTSPRTSVAIARFICIFLCLFCIMRIVQVVQLHDLDYAKKVLFLTSFGLEIGLIIMYSILLVVFMPWDDAPESVIFPVMNTFLGYYIVRFCYTCIMGSFIFGALFRLLLLYFPFNGFVYASAVVLTIGMMLSLLRMASIYYAHRIKQGSRK